VFTLAFGANIDQSRFWAWELAGFPALPL